MMVLFRTRLGKTLIWQKFSQTRESDFNQISFLIFKTIERQWLSFFSFRYILNDSPVLVVGWNCRDCREARVWPWKVLTVFFDFHLKKYTWFLVYYENRTKHRRYIAKNKDIFSIKIIITTQFPWLKYFHPLNFLVLPFI